MMSGGQPANEQPIEVDERILDRHPHPLLEKITSRKLILAAITMASLVGLWLGTAVIEPTLFETARTEIRIFAGLIASVGGTGTFLQYVIDKDGS